MIIFILHVDVHSIAVCFYLIFLNFYYNSLINLFAFLHVHIRFRDGDTIDVLADALDDLRKTLQGVRAISFTGDSHDVIEYAANLLGPSKLSKLSFINVKIYFNISLFFSVY